MYILDINQPFNIIYIGTIMFDLNINNNNNKTCGLVNIVMSNLLL